MKKTVIFGIIGLAAGMATSYGQGYITLDNYNGGPLVEYGTGIPANGVSGSLGTPGAPLNNAWTVGLYFVGGTTSLTDPVGTGIPISPLALGTGPGSTVGVAGTEVGGVLGQYTSIPSFNSGSSTFATITLELVVYDTAGGTYANAGYRIHSTPFSIGTVSATSGSPSYSGTGQPAGALMVLPASVPEPTTLALAGLGGLASLIALRRKQA